MTPSSPSVPLHVATWNVNSLRTRLAHVLDFLRDHTPDVLCLQELKADDKALPREAFETLGYHIEALCQKTYNGVAIISPYPIEDVHTGFSDGPEDPQARVIAATVRGVRIINVYVPNGSEVGSDKYDYKLKWMGRLSDELAGHFDPKAPVLLCGDFNVAMEPRDLYDPVAWEGRVLYSEPEKKAARRWLEWGLVDSFRLHHDEAGIYSWWDYRQGAYAAGRGLRIDHIWVTQSLAAACTACDVVTAPRELEKPSDHAPVVARFEGVASP
ncbi:MAG: exodeoxyribonuclease III [Leptospirillia bacterium]